MITLQNVQDFMKIVSDGLTVTLVTLQVFPLYLQYLNVCNLNPYTLLYVHIHTPRHDTFLIVHVTCTILVISYITIFTSPILSQFVTRVTSRAQ